jgi:uncharacterized protein YbjT (DUF2867 family)
MKTIIVCGATGKQGSAVLNRLLESKKWNAIALSRNPQSEKAMAIKKRGVNVLKADLQDKSSLIKAFENAYGVYGVTTPENAKGKMDTKMEREQGFNIVDACKNNGIKHLVLSTVLYLSEKQGNIPYVKSKQDIEKYVIKNNVPYTFLRPSSFIDEIGGPFLPVKKHTVTGQADGDAKVPYIACEDIGNFARAAFEDPQKYLNQKINLVGDFLSGDELARLLSTFTNGKVNKHKVPPKWLMKIFAREWLPLRRFFEESGRPPYPENLMEAIINCKKSHPEILSFERFLELHGREKLNM